MFDADMLHLAARQFGVVSRRQLTDFGISNAQISRARRAGLVTDVTARTLRIRSSPDTFLARCAAVSLHLGGDGFLSGPTAGRLYGLRDMSVRTIHVIVPSGHRVTLPRWAAIRSSRWFDAVRDRQVQRASRIVARPHRMLYDLAATLDDRRFRRAAEDCWHLGLVTPNSASDYLEHHRCRGKDGTAVMERWLELACSQRRPAQSGLELDLIDALRDVGLPDPIRQHRLVLPGGVRIHVDLAWPDIALCVEPGHTWWHGGDDAIRRDNERRLGALAIGWETIQLDESLRLDLHQAAHLIKLAYDRRAAMIIARQPRPARTDVGS